MKRKPYPAYKPSGVEWLGDVPEHWIVLSLRYLFDIKAGGDLKEEFYSEERSERYPYPIYTNSVKSYEAYGFSSKPFFKSNTITVTGRGEIGYATYRDHEYDAIIRLLVLTPKKNAPCKYYAYFINSMIDFFGGSTAISQLSTEQISPYKVFSPPFQEQQAIAAFLDQETGCIDTLVAKKERLIELLREKRSALISHTVTKGLEPMVKLKPSGVEWLGAVPEHWEVKRVKNISNTISKGTTPSTEGFEISLEGIIKFIKAENIVGDNVSPYPEFFIDEETNRALSRSILKEKDLLIVIAGATIGKVAILEKEFIPANTNQAVCFIRLRNPEMARFVWYYLRSDLIRNLIAINSVQSAQPNISMGTLKDTVVPHPPLSEQQSIVAFLDRETGKIDALIANVEAAIAKLKEYRTALISAAVTGKIDVREAA